MSSLNTPSPLLPHDGSVLVLHEMLEVQLVGDVALVKGRFVL